MTKQRVPFLLNSNARLLTPYASMAQIALSVGCSKATLYLYFKSK